jgi:predicted transposase YdaD
MDISKDQEERARFMSRRKFETDLTSNLLTAEARGEARGLKEGEARGEARGEKRSRLAMAAKMKEEGIEISVIMRVTALSVDEILNA